MRIEAGWSLSGICIDWDRCSAFDEFQAHLFSGKPENIDELDKRDRQSLFLMRARRLTSRKDLAVHVSLSSYLIVKQRANDTYRSETSSAQFFNWVAVCPRNSRETLRRCRVTAASPAGSLYVQLDRTVNNDLKKLRVSNAAPGNSSENLRQTPLRALVLIWEGGVPITRPACEFRGEIGRSAATLDAGACFWPPRGGRQAPGGPGWPSRAAKNGSSPP